VDTALITLLANAGTAGIVIVLLLTKQLVPGWLYRRLEDENKALSERGDWDRQRADEVTKAGAVTNQLIGAIVDLANGDHGQDRALKPPARDGEKPGLTWEDIA